MGALGDFSIKADGNSVNGISCFWMNGEDSYYPGYGLACPSMAVIKGNDYVEFYDPSMTSQKIIAVADVGVAENKKAASTPYLRDDEDPYLDYGAGGGWVNRYYFEEDSLTYSDGFIYRGLRPKLNRLWCDPTLKSLFHISLTDGVLGWQASQHVINNNYTKVGVGIKLWCDVNSYYTSSRDFPIYHFMNYDGTTSKSNVYLTSDKEGPSTPISRTFNADGTLHTFKPLLFAPSRDYYGYNDNQQAYLECFYYKCCLFLV